MTHPTPRWWRGLSTRAQVGLLAVLLPGALLHEWTHAVVARRWTSATIDWDYLVVAFGDWDGAPAWGVALVYLAPFLVGWVLGAVVVVVIVVVGVPVTEASVAVGLFVLPNWVVYTWAVVGDLGFVDVLIDETPHQF